MSDQLLRSLVQDQLKSDVPEFGPGDTVRVSVRVVEGERERIQDFEGVVIRRRSGGINENFTVRRIASHAVGVERTFLLHSPRIDRIEVTRRGRVGAHSIGVERTFLLHSPRIDTIKVVRRGKVRRAKLYYLRNLSGKAARIKERRY